MPNEKEIFEPVRKLNLQYFAGDADTDDQGDDSNSDDQSNLDQNNQQDDKSQDDKFDADYVRSLRKENAKHRTENKKIQQQNEQLQNQIKAINKALGLEGDEPNVDDLTKQLSQKETQLKNLQIENAFSRIAAKVGADTELTMAVLHRKGALNDLNPNEKDFASSLETIIKAEVDSNPKLKSTEVIKTGDVPPNSQGGGTSMDMNSIIRRLAGRQ